MAFGTKYKTTWYDYFGNYHLLELRKDAYSGSEYSILGGKYPAIIKDKNRGKNKMKPIHGTELAMSFVPDFDSSNYDFEGDFQSTTDRQWQAIVKKTLSSGIYNGSFRIDSLNLSNNSVDPTCTIEITHLGDLAVKPTCRLDCTVANYPDSGFEYLQLYACPAGEGVDSPDAKFLAEVRVNYDDSQSDWIDRLVADYGSITKIDINTIEYEQQTYDADIDATWSVKVKYRSSLWKPFTATYYNFSGKTERQWIQVQFTSADADNPTSDTPKQVSALGTHYHSVSDTLDSIAEDLKDQINGKTLDYVYFPDLEDSLDDGFRNLEFSATRSGATITITMKDMGADGNGIPVRGQDESDYTENDSYMQVAIRDGSNYTFTETDFSGGGSGGDYFKFEVNEGSGFVTIGQTTGYSGDTAAAIIQRLVTNINNNNFDYEAEINSSNTSQCDVTVNVDASTYEYRFTTDGASDIDEAASGSESSTTFTSASKQQIIWMGWVKPGGYQRLHTAGDVEIRLTAVDGLGDLRNFKFEVGDKRPFQKLTVIDIISKILKQTPVLSPSGLYFRIYEAFELWAVGTDGTSPPLKQVYEDTSRLNGVDCYTALVEILKLMKGRIRQRLGRWEIIPLNQIKNTSYTYRVYDYLGKYLGVSTRSSYQVSVGGSNNVNFANRSVVRQAESPFRKVETRQDFGLQKQILKFPTFNLIEENLNNIQYPWKWKYGDETRLSFLDKVYTQDGYLHIAKKATAQAGVYYLQQNFQIGDVDFGETEEKQYKLEIRYRQGKDNDQAAANVTVKLYVTNGTATWYLRDDDDFYGSDYFMTLENKENNGDTTFTRKFDYPAGIFPDDQQLDAYVEIYQETDGDIRIQSIKLDINIEATSGRRMESYYDEQVDNVAGEIREEPIKLGDALNVVMAESIYKNALFWIDSDGIPRLTDYWTTQPDSSDYEDTQVRLVESMRHFYLKSYAKQISRLEGDILGDIEMEDILKDTTDSNRLYHLIGGQHNLRTSIITGEWQEIDIDDSAFTRTDVTLVAEEKSGASAYSDVPAGEGGEEVDLSDYVTEDQMKNALRGKKGSFTGSDLTNRQITIYHYLEETEPILLLFDKDNKQIGQDNFSYDTEDSNDYIVLTINIPIGSSETVKYRFL